MYAASYHLGTFQEECGVESTVSLRPECPVRCIRLFCRESQRGGAVGKTYCYAALILARLLLSVKLKSGANSLFCQANT